LTVVPQSSGLARAASSFLNFGRAERKGDCPVSCHGSLPVPETRGSPLGSTPFSGEDAADYAAGGATSVNVGVEPSHWVTPWRSISTLPAAGWAGRT
jgi:hypothetical protein